MQMFVAKLRIYLQGAKQGHGRRCQMHPILVFARDVLKGEQRNWDESPSFNF